MDKNISPMELEILRLLLGDGIASSFMEFLKDRIDMNGMNINGMSGGYSEKIFIDVRNFRERDLVGWWDYDDCYFDDKYYWKPKWFEDLERTCRKNPGKRYEVVFTGAEHASGVVYGKIKNLCETGYLCSEIKLPANARYGKIKLGSRIEPRTNGIGPRPFQFGVDEYDVLR